MCIRDRPNAHDDRSHRYFAGFQGALGAAEGLFHPKFVRGSQLSAASGQLPENQFSVPGSQFSDASLGLETAPSILAGPGGDGASPVSTRLYTGITPGCSRQCYPMRDMGITEILRKVFLVDLIQGLNVTFRYQDPKEIYTEQYPLERPQVAERYRGAPRLNVNPDTDERCVVLMVSSPFGWCR